MELEKHKGKNILLMPFPPCHLITLPPFPPSHLINLPPTFYLPKAMQHNFVFELHTHFLE